MERGSEGGAREKFVGGRAGSFRLSCLVASVLSWNCEAKSFTKSENKGQLENMWRSY